MFITVPTVAHHPFAEPVAELSPHPPTLRFRDVSLAVFYATFDKSCGFTPKLEDRPLSPVCACLLIVFVITLTCTRREVCCS